MLVVWWNYELDRLLQFRFHLEQLLCRYTDTLFKWMTKNIVLLCFYLHIILCNWQSSVFCTVHLHWRCFKSCSEQLSPKKSLQSLLQRFADFALKYIFKTLFPPQSYACTTIFVDEEFSVSTSGLSECHNSLLKYEAEAHVLYTVHHVRKALNLHSVWWPAGVDCLRSDCRSESASRDYNRTCM